MKTFSLTAKLIFSSLFIYGSLIAYSGTIPLKDISKNLSHYTASIPLVNSIENEEEIESEQKQNIQIAYRIKIFLKQILTMIRL